MEKKAEWYIDLLKQGNWDGAFPGIEDRRQVLAALAEAFAGEEDPGVRAELVSVVGQHRRMESVPFLARALEDPEPRVWKAALDSLVTVGGDPALEALQSAAARFKSEGRAQADRVEWIAEAVQQVQEPLPEDDTAAGAAAEFDGEDQPAGRSREELISFFQRMGYVNLHSREEYEGFMEYVRKFKVATWTQSDKKTGIITIHERSLGTIEGLPG